MIILLILAVLCILILSRYFISFKRGDYNKIKIGSVLQLYGAVTNYTGIVFDIKHDPAARIDGTYQNIKYYIFIKDTDEFVSSQKRDISFESISDGKILVTNEKIWATREMSFTITNSRMSSSVTRHLQKEYGNLYDYRR